MKKGIILLITVALTAIISSFILSYFNNLNNQTESYQLYMSNTNFSVVFEDGNWSEEFKSFVLKDLNLLLRDVSGNLDGVRSPATFTINNMEFSTTNKLKFSYLHIPSYISPAQKDDLGYIYWGNKEYVIIPDEIMSLYTELDMNYKSDNELYHNLNDLCLNILPNFSDLNKQELNNYIMYINMREKDIKFSDLQDDEVEKLAGYISDMFSSSVFPYSWLFVRDINTINEDISDTERTIFSGVSYLMELYLYDENKEPYLRSNKFILVYASGQWKFLILAGGE